MNINTTVCDSCRLPVGNKFTVTVQGKLLCSLPCGRREIGEHAYLRAWHEAAMQVTERNSRYGPRVLKVAK